MTAVLGRLTGTTGAVRPPLLQRRVVQHAVTIGLALVVSRQLGLISEVPPIAVLAIPPAVAVVYLFLKHPKWCLLGLFGTTFFGLYRYAVSVGPVNVRVNDVPLIFLIGWALLYRARYGKGRASHLGQQYVGLYLGAIAFTLVFALVRVPDDAPRLVVAWLRLLSTFLLIWIVPYVIREQREVLFVLRGLAVCIAAELAYACLRSMSVLTVNRLQGSNGPTVEGLLAASLLLMAIHSPVPRARSARVAMFGLGGLCLYLTNSIGSLAATGIVLGIFGLRTPAHGEAKRKQGLLRPARLVLLLVGVVGVLSVLRPLDLPTSEHFGGSSAGSRLLIGIAGAKIFLDNPIFGVGWQRSSRPDVIATRDLVDELKEEFPDFNPAFYPSPDSRTATVHNAYIQTLAEAGVIGGAMFIIALVAVGRRIRRTVATLTGTAKASARMAAILALATVIWLNDNPLFGSQPETVLLATVIGLVAAVAAMHAMNESMAVAPANGARPSVPQP